MRDHREGQDPTRLVDITNQLRAIGRSGSAVRVTRPDWRLGRPRPTTVKQQAKARRRQAAESRKRNRT